MSFDIGDNEGALSAELRLPTNVLRPALAIKLEELILVAIKRHMPYLRSSVAEGTLKVAIDPDCVYLIREMPLQDIDQEELFWSLDVVCRFFNATRVWVCYVRGFLDLPVGDVTQILSGSESVWTLSHVCIACWKSKELEKTHHDKEDILAAAFDKKCPVSRLWRYDFKKEIPVLIKET